MRSYIRTYYRLRKWEPLIALGFQRGGEGLNFCIRGTPPWVLSCERVTHILRSRTRPKLDVTAQDGCHGPSWMSRPKLDVTAQARCHGPRWVSRPKLDVTAQAGYHGPSWMSRPKLDVMAQAGCQSRTPAVQNIITQPRKHLAQKKQKTKYVANNTVNI